MWSNNLSYPSSIPTANNPPYDECCCEKTLKPDPIIPSLIRELGSELSEIYALTAAIADEVAHLRGERLEDKRPEPTSLREGLELNCIKARESSCLLHDILSLFRSDV